MKIPKELSLFKTQFSELKKSKPFLEETWAFTKEWNQTTWNDWKGCALRIKTDAACLDETTLYVIDHKTGKFKPGYEEQMSLYAVGGMLKFPHVKEVVTQLWYLDSGDQPEMVYTADRMKELRAEWEKKIKPMMNDKRFPPKPGSGCRWCHFSKSKGGPCKY